MSKEESYKVCLLGVKQDILGEGVTNLVSNLSRELSKKHQLLTLDISLKKMFAPSFWNKLKAFKPQIVHRIPGLTIKGLLATKIIGAIFSAKTVISASFSRSSLALRKLLKFFKPDLILYQSSILGETINRLKCKALFLPNGVDVSKFVAVSNQTKLRLREKYNIEKKKFVILHAGHLVKHRRLDILSDFQSGDTQVLIVVSPLSGYQDKKILNQLISRGCKIIRGYSEQIEEIYALSDCYIFPVECGCSISIPLSVLEAMACNLPVISRRFEGLTSIFKEGGGLFYVDQQQDFLRVLNLIKQKDIEINTRKKILPYSWEKVAERLTNAYSQLIDS